MKYKVFTKTCGLHRFSSMSARSTKPSVLSPAQYIAQEDFQVPKGQLVYSPQHSTTFARQGERMVDKLLKVSPSFATHFDKRLSPEKQAALASMIFEKQKQEFEEEWTKMPDSLKVGQGKKYFQTNRQFGRLVPLLYKRTEAPRLSTTGTTFHGMKKSLLLPILAEISIILNRAILDVDMSAAHSRIAKYLLKQPDSVLGLSLKDPDFWATQVEHLSPIAKRKGVEIPFGVLKKILKVGLYTSLNGGNPTSEARLMNNLENNAEKELQKLNLTSKEALISSELWSVCHEILSSFDLIKEVRKLNEQCAVKTGEKEYSAFTVDRFSPYKFPSKHLGISRVLQGFEVVLLTVLVYQIVASRCLPLSLDHDGVLIMAPPDSNPEEICNNLSGTIFKDWSNFLLNDDLPIEPKRLIVDGKIKEF